MRPFLAVVAGAGVAAIGALLLGEYAFTGWPIFGACILFGLFLAEVVASVGRWKGARPASLTALLTALGLVWAAWISSGRELMSLPDEGWFAIAAGTLVGAATACRLWRRGLEE